MKTVFLLFTILTIPASKIFTQTVTDIDGNVYNTVTIGSQIWMKENLRTTHFRSGESIPNVINEILWGIRGSSAYANYNNNDSLTEIYGRLYNWYSVTDSLNIAPDGWHVPSNAEWIELINYLGGASTAGGKLKEAGFVHWSTSNTGDDSSGFKGLPGGHRDTKGVYKSIRLGGWFWSSTNIFNNDAYHLHLESSSNIVCNPSCYSDRLNGLSVRCIKDSISTKIIKVNNIDRIKIFPNPASNYVNIVINDMNNIEMQLYNIDGEVVIQTKLLNGNNKFDISSLSNGIYEIKITGTNWVLINKLVKL